MGNMVSQRAAGAILMRVFRNTFLFYFITIIVYYVNFHPLLSFSSQIFPIFFLYLLNVTELSELKILRLVS